MPRARFVHPDITTDPDFAEFPRDVRLFFVYMLTQADDAGNFADDSRELKARTFPYDDDITPITIVEWINLLYIRNLYVGYTFNERIYYHIKNFHKYQRPINPTQPKYPLHPGQKYTFSYREKGKWMKRTVTEKQWNAEAYGERYSNVMLKEGKGSNNLTFSPPSSDSPPTADPEPGPIVPATGPAHPPGNGATPIDYTRSDHWDVLNTAQLFGIDATEVKTLEELTQLIEKVPQSVKRKALGR